MSIWARYFASPIVSPSWLEESELTELEEPPDEVPDEAPEEVPEVVPDVPVEALLDTEEAPEDEANNDPVDEPREM